VFEIIGNAKFGEIDNLPSQGRNMDYIAKHYHMDLCLAWAIRLEGKTGQERFEELGWGLRTWDQWNFNDLNASEMIGLPAIGFAFRRVSNSPEFRCPHLSAFIRIPDFGNRKPEFGSGRAGENTVI
jgi:hypothetical protein